MTQPLIESLRMTIELAHGELESIRRDLSSVRYQLKMTPWLFLNKKVKLKNTFSSKKREASLCQKNIQIQEELLNNWVRTTH